MSRSSRISRHLSWAALLLAILAAFSFHTAAGGSQAHPGQTARGTVVIDTDDDPWDDPSVDDGDPDGGTVVAALGRRTLRPRSPRPGLATGAPRRPVPVSGAGPQAAVRQIPAPSGAALLTRLGVSLT